MSLPVFIPLCAIIHTGLPTPTPCPGSVLSQIAVAVFKLTN